LTSVRKFKANRANARASTGPNTARGRTRAARNAFRREIAGPDANASIQELARRVAEAQIDLRRVRDARHQLLFNALRDRQPPCETWSSATQRTRNIYRGPDEVSNLDIAKPRQVCSNSVARGRIKVGNGPL